MLDRVAAADEAPGGALGGHWGGALGVVVVGSLRAVRDPQGPACFKDGK